LSSSFRIQKVRKLSEAQFADIRKVWEITKIGNPARGDNLAAINHTLKHGGLILLASDNDRVIGTAWLTHDCRRLYIHHMAVLPEYQNHHVGKSLLDEALKYASELGLQAKLEVHKDNPSGRHLYENAGFEYLDGYLVMVKRR